MIKKKDNFFILETKNTQYILEVDAENKLVQNHYGAKISDCIPCRAEVRSFFCVEENEKSDEGKNIEYPTFGHTDFRTPAFVCELPDGSCVTEFVYEGYRILPKKKPLNVMPSAKNGGESLVVVLQCKNAPIKIELCYSVCEDCDVIVKNAAIVSEGCDIAIDVAFSQSLALSGFDQVCYLAGAWARERHLQRRKLGYGIFEISEARGTSGHNLNPFFALLKSDTTETGGEAVGVNLIYSGSHAAKIETDRFGKVRIVNGINPFNFRYKLKKGERFETPEAVLTYSAEGLGKMSRNFHDFVNTCIISDKWAKKDRPVLINNWEATYFDFTEEKLLDIAQTAKNLGIELFVLDDGWFGKRDLDNCSLGDWKPYLKKLPQGIAGLADKIRAKGMQFGLWFEPEMVSEDSDLFRAHPDWVIRVGGIAPSKGRCQLVLDLTRREVQDFIVSVFDEYLSDGKISYVKWDMNRYLSDVPRKGYCHEYTLGLYSVLNRIFEKYPDVLFEGCSGGGGRFDLGMLCYFPQIWTSDDTDAAERLKIQGGTSLAYPLSCISAHVTITPNHQTGRVCDMYTRFAVACFGVFGYELDLGKEPQRDEIKDQITFYKKIRKITLYGDFYRLSDGNVCSFQAVSKDKRESVVLMVKERAVPNIFEEPIKLQGLKDGAVYELSEGVSRTGADLMYRGYVPQPDYGDFKAQLILLKEKNLNV